MIACSTNYEIHPAHPTLAQAKHYILRVAPTSTETLQQSLNPFFLQKLDSSVAHEEVRRITCTVLLTGTRN